MLAKTIVLCAYTCFLIAFLAIAEVLEVKYSPVPESAEDTRFEYAIGLLKKVLQKTENSHGPFNLKPAINMNVGRAVEYLKVGDTEHVNVVWTTTSYQRENALLPILIPIRKGLLGYRIFLIRKQDKDKFVNVRSLQELKQFRVGQNHIWNDVKVFEANGFRVTKGSDYEGLFHMLVLARFDFFSRGINEALVEYEGRKEKFPNLHVEETILLYYPWPKYFFTSKRSPDLAIRIERGLRVMIDDGSFEKHFMEYHERDIKRANLRSRKLFKIQNPLLPPSAPLDQKHLWYDPFQAH